MFMKLYNLFLTLLLSLLLCSIDLLQAQQLTPTYQAHCINSTEGKKSIKDLIETDTNIKNVAGNNLSITINANLESMHDIHLLGGHGFYLCNCTEIDLSNNKITADLFKPIFNTLPNLTKLNVSHNQIKSLPNIVHDNLAYLNLNNNHISELHLPHIIASLKKLTHLHACHNTITTLHEDNFEKDNCDKRISIFYKEKNYLPIHPLQELNIAHNNIGELYLTHLLNNLFDIISIDFSANPLTQVHSDNVTLRTVVPTIKFNNTHLSTDLIQKILINSSPSLKVKINDDMFKKGIVSFSIMEAIGFTMWMIAVASSPYDQLEVISESVFPIATALWFIGFCIYTKKADLYQKVYIPLFDQQASDIEQGSNTPLL